MFCHKCGANLGDGSTFCPYCGTQTGSPNTAAQQPYYQSAQQNNMQSAQPQNTLAIVGFILSFFVTVPGLIISILDYNAAKRGAPHMGFAKAGIIISAVSIGLSILVGIVYGSMISAFLSALLSAPGGI